MSTFKVVGSVNIKLSLVFLQVLVLTYAHADIPPLEGRYYLDGVMEMAAELQLRKDGTFDAGVGYGSAGGYAKGTWYVEDDVLTLESDTNFRQADKLIFDSFRERPKNELVEVATNNKYYPLDFWEKNYILELRYARYRELPRIKPKFVHFKFDHGPAASLQFKPGGSARAMLPYDPQRTIKEIGFTTSQMASPEQWFDVAPGSRMFSFRWKKPKHQPILYVEPEEFTLAETQRWFEGQDDVQVDTNYIIELFHDDPKTPPPIGPVDVYWQFQDRSTLSNSWTNSVQNKISLPYVATKELKKFGLRMKNSTGAIEWFEVAPDARWMILKWDAEPNPAEGDLSVLFQDMQLEVMSECLRVAIGGDKGCFRRR